MMTVRPENIPPLTLLDMQGFDKPSAISLGTVHPHIAKITGHKKALYYKGTLLREPLLNSNTRRGQLVHAHKVRTQRPYHANRRQAAENALGSSYTYGYGYILRLLQHLLAASGNDPHDLGFLFLSISFVVIKVYFTVSGAVCHVVQVLCL